VHVVKDNMFYKFASRAAEPL